LLRVLLLPRPSSALWTVRRLLLRLLLRPPQSDDTRTEGTRENKDARSSTERFLYSCPPHRVVGLKEVAQCPLPMRARRAQCSRQTGKHRGTQTEKGENTLNQNEAQTQMVPNLLPARSLMQCGFRSLRLFACALHKRAARASLASLPAERTSLHSPSHGAYG